MTRQRPKLESVLALETMLTVEYATQLHQELSKVVDTLSPDVKLLAIKLGQALNARDAASLALTQYDSEHRAVL